MTYDVSSFLDSLKATFVAASSTMTASLTTNVTSLGTDSILIGNPARLTRQIDQYPCLIINPRSNTFPMDEIGMASGSTARAPEVMVDIYCMTQCASDSEDADKQARILARNVCKILETNVEKQATTSTINDGWHMCVVNNQIFDGGYVEGSQTYQSSVKLETSFKSWSIR